MFLIVILAPDVMHEVIADILGTERTTARLLYGSKDAHELAIYYTLYNDVTDSPVQMRRHSKQNSCEQVGIIVRSEYGCKHMLQCSPLVSSSSSASPPRTMSTSASGVSDGEKSSLIRFAGGLAMVWYTSGQFMG